MKVLKLAVTAVAAAAVAASASVGLVVSTKDGSLQGSIMDLRLNNKSTSMPASVL